VPYRNDFLNQKPSHPRKRAGPLRRPALFKFEFWWRIADAFRTSTPRRFQAEDARPDVIRSQGELRAIP
jgi:hypothetical protein